MYGSFSNSIILDGVRTMKKNEEKKMIDVTKDVKKLYMDAVFYCLIRKGHSDHDARSEVKRIFDKR